jgi:hypothetical protein
MQVRISCHHSQIEDYTSNYEASGFRLISKEVVNSEQVILFFQGSSTSHAAEAAYWDQNAQAYIQFEDGVVSPLYVRRSRWMED